MVTIIHTLISQILRLMFPAQASLLSTVVPELTTDEILAFGAPGEAFEGVLVSG